MERGREANATHGDTGMGGSQLTKRTPLALQRQRPRSAHAGWDGPSEEGSGAEGKDGTMGQEDVVALAEG